MSHITYQNYLEHWDAHFGEATDGEYGFWSAGGHHICPVHRLTETEFLQHVQALDQASGEFLAAHQTSDLVGMDIALAHSFPHELALLI